MKLGPLMCSSQSSLSFTSNILSQIIGHQKLKVQVTKATKNWVAKPQFVPTQQLPFRRELVGRLMELSKAEPMETEEGKKKKKFARGNIAKQPKPDLSELLSRVSDRFRHQKK